MSSLLTTAKVNINIGNCKLYARKSDDFIDKWIVIRKYCGVAVIVVQLVNSVVIK